METKELTVKELLVQVRDNLNEIRIPASELQNIGLPIAQAINGLTACIDAINNAEAKPKQDDIPEIELVPAEEENGDQDA